MPRPRMASRVSFPLGFGGGIHPKMSGEENCRFVARIYGQEIENIAADVGSLKPA